MTRSIGALLLALALASCSAAAPTGPPTGLPVTLAGVNETTLVPVVQSGGDSATVTIATNLVSESCHASHGDAGIDGGALVTTITVEYTAPIPCANILPPASTRIAVHQVPAGHYTLVLRLRVMMTPNEPSEHEITRADVTLP